MANDKPQLDEGFEEVPLDEGFTEVPVDQVPQKPGKVESFLRGASQGATLGLQKYVSPVIEKGLAMVDPTVDASDYVASTPEEYAAENKAAQQANPKMYMIGQIAGGVLPSVVLPGGATASIGKTIGTSTVAGAVQGAAEAEGGAGDKLVGGLSGGTFGALGGFGGHMLGKLMGAGKALEEASESFVAKTAQAQRGIPGGSKYGVERLQKIGRVLQSKNLADRPQTYRAIRAELDSELRKAGPQVDALFQQADQLGIGPTKSEVVESLFKKLNEGLDTDAANKATQRILQEMKGLPDNVPLKPSVLWKISQKIDDITLPYDKQVPESLASVVHALDEASGHLRSMNKDYISAVAPELADSVKEASTVYGALKTAHKTVSQTMIKGTDMPSSLQNLFQSPVLRGTVNQLILNPIKGIAKLPGKYGPVLESAMKRGTPALTATVYSLMNSDPDFRASVEEVEQFDEEIESE